MKVIEILTNLSYKLCTLLHYEHEYMYIVIEILEIPKCAHFYELAKQENELRHSLTRTQTEHVLSRGLRRICCSEPKLFTQSDVLRKMKCDTIDSQPASGV